ncbi:MAG: DUF493 family protein [Myxococcota bacterium]
MENQTQNMDRLRELLDAEYQWPALYTFKFIVPSAQAEQVERLFPPGASSRRNSAKGNYVTVSATLNVGSAESVIAMYEDAAHIEGLISI